MYFEDFKLGMTAETGPVRIEREKLDRFAREYDPLPLHTDEAYARTTRFGRLVAPGVMVFMSVWAQYLADVDFVGGQFIAGQTTRIEWFLPTFADDLLTGKVEVTALRPRNPYNGTVELTLDAYNQRGERVLQNVTELLVATRQSG